MSASKGQLLVGSTAVFGYRGNMANIERGIYIGNYEACDSAQFHFNRVIHIYHESQPGICSACGSPSSKRDLVLNWREHDPISKEMFDSVWNFVRADEDSRILVHCAAGIGRSAHMSVVALVARGCPLGRAVGLVTEAQLSRYHSRVIPNWDRDNLYQLDNFICSTEASV